MPPKPSPFFFSLFTASGSGHGGAKATRLFRFFSSPAATVWAHDSVDNSGFIVKYLVASCGFSPTEASRVGKPLNHIKSSEKPDAVLRFLEDLGLDRHQIKKVITWKPGVLTYNVEKTLKTKIQTIRDLGFSGPEIAELVAVNPCTLLVIRIAPKIELLRSHLPHKDDLLKALKRDPHLLNCNPEETIIPNYRLLRDCGVPDDRISKALVDMPWLLSRNARSFKVLVDQIVSLGFNCRSKMFLYCLYAISRLSKEKLEAKRRFMKSFGWSDDDFFAAFRKVPNFVKTSEEKLGATMKFLLQEAGCEAGYIAANPRILIPSLEGRLKPRIRARQLLKAEGLPGGEIALGTITNMPDDKFWNAYVLPHINKIPALKEIYQAEKFIKLHWRDAIA